MSGAFGGLAEGLAVGGALLSGEGVLAAVGFGNFAALGEISFALLGSPERMRRSRATRYAKLPILESRPVVQWMYDDLERVVIQIKLHELWLGSGGPERAFEMLDQQRLSHAPMPLVFGGSRAPEGTYVVLSVQAIDRWRYAGVSQWMDVRLALQEWAATGMPESTPPRPSVPPAGIIGVPGGFAALYALGATVGAALPTLGFASTTASAITRVAPPWRRL